MSLPWAAETARRERRAPGAPCPWQETLLQKSARWGKLVLPGMNFSRFAGTADPPLRRVLLLVVSLSRPRGKGTCARDIPRTRRACHQCFDGRKPLSFMPGEESISHAQQRV